MKTTRQHIVDYLQQKRFATAAEIGRALRVTSSNVRHHLSILVEEGAVEAIGQRPPKGRGRPSTLYAQTQQAHQHNLDGLASTLLQLYVADCPEAERESRLERMAASLQGVKSWRGGSLTQQLVQAVNRLNQLGYRARWEARAPAPQVTLGQCPFAPIIQEHPELCAMDSRLISGLIEEPVEQTAKLATDKRGAIYCKFVIGKVS
jgi:DeoR family suf operon transcriptional repressor